jgi:hypothetical protein
LHDSFADVRTQHFWEDECIESLYQALSFMIYGEILSLPRKAGIVPLLTPYILYAAGKRLYMYAVPVSNLLLFRRAKYLKEAHYAAGYHQIIKPAINQISAPETSRSEYASGYDSPHCVSISLTATVHLNMLQ